MSAVYFIGALRVHDADGWAHYQQAARASASGVELSVIALNGNPHVLEGTLPATTLVVLRFPDHDRFEAWWHSDAYLAAVPLRQTAAQTLFALRFEGQ